MYRVTTQSHGRPDNRGRKVVADLVRQIRYAERHGHLSDAHALRQRLREVYPR